MEEYSEKYEQEYEGYGNLEIARRPSCNLGDLTLQKHPKSVIFSTFGKNPIIKKDLIHHGRKGNFTSGPGHVFCVGGAADGLEAAGASAAGRGAGRPWGGGSLQLRDPQVWGALGHVHVSGA